MGKREGSQIQGLLFGFVRSLRRLPASGSSLYQGDQDNSFLFKNSAPQAEVSICCAAFALVWLAVDVLMQLQVDIEKVKEEEERLRKAELYATRTYKHAHGSSCVCLLCALSADC
jgi:hypothetical protein